MLLAILGISWLVHTSLQSLLSYDVLLCVLLFHLSLAGAPRELSRAWCALICFFKLLIMKVTQAAIQYHFMLTTSLHSLAHVILIEVRFLHQGLGSWAPAGWSKGLPSSSCCAPHLGLCSSSTLCCAPHPAPILFTPGVLSGRPG